MTPGFRSLHWGGAPVRAAIVRAMEDGRPMLEYLPGCDAFSDITILTENSRSSTDNIRGASSS